METKPKFSVEVEEEVYLTSDVVKIAAFFDACGEKIPQGKKADVMESFLMRDELKNLDIHYYKDSIDTAPWCLCNENKEVVERGVDVLLLAHFTYTGNNELIAGAIEALNKELNESPTKE